MPLKRLELNKTSFYSLITKDFKMVLRVMTLMVMSPNMDPEWQYTLI